ncbi:MAG: hypothetical protein SFX72_05630 [Isosphaeraceae bacterium]|nr:hypothetical protein [Isosphaeraceae bacterium]
MRPSTKRILIGAAVVLAVPAIVVVGLRLSLRHEPRFYRQLLAAPRAEVEVDAKRFEQDSLQLRNDIVNEPTWEGVFTAREVNAWLADGLSKHFGDQIPSELRDPRVLFEQDRILLAFQWTAKGITTVVSAELEVDVPEDNVLEFVIGSVRAGALPLPTDRFLEPLRAAAAERGLLIEWDEVEGRRRVRVAVGPEAEKPSVALERVDVAPGQIRLSGRSIRATDAQPWSPDRGSNSRTQPEPAPPAPSEVVRSATDPRR